MTEVRDSDNLSEVQHSMPTVRFNTSELCFVMTKSRASDEW